MRNRLYNIIQILLAIPVHALGLSKDRLSLKAALTRCRRRELNIGTVIDIGASDGRWSLKARKFFPDSSFYWSRRKGAHEKALARLKLQKNWLDYIITAAGDRDGEIYFDASNLFGGVASNTPFETNCITVPVKTVDSLVKKKG